MTPSLLKDLLPKLRHEFEKDMAWYTSMLASSDHKYPAYADQLLDRLVLSAGDVLIQELGE